MLTLGLAQRAIDSAIDKAESMGLAMNIAVVDAGSNLVAFVRMDGAWLGSVDIAQNKAFTARAFDLSTRELAGMAEPGQPLYGIQATNHGRVVIFAGGIPIEMDGEIVGAIGVSGGKPDEDNAVAEAGVAALSGDPTSAAGG